MRKLLVLVFFLLAISATGAIAQTMHEIALEAGRKAAIFVLVLKGGILIAIAWFALSNGLSGKQAAPIKHGLKVTAWMATAAAIATPTFRRVGLDVAAFIVISVVVWGIVGFVGGYVWRKLRPLAATATNSSTSARSIAQAARSTKTIEPDEQHWAAALAEFDSENRRTGLWAKVYSEAHGNEAAAKAHYLQTRADELRNEPIALQSAPQSNDPAIASTTRPSQAALIYVFIAIVILGVLTYFLSANSNRVAQMAPSSANETLSSVSLPASKRTSGELFSQCSHDEMIIVARKGSLDVLSDKCLAALANLFDAKQECSGPAITWTNCFAQLSFPNGSRYSGKFKNGEYNGDGMYTFSDKRIYVGEFKDGKRNGNGTLYRPDGSQLLSGSWVNDVLVDGN